jgi:transposase InsO family protein
LSLPRFKPDSNHNQPVAPNLLDQDFEAQQRDQKWVTDITYVPTAEGWLYLAVVMDLYSRRIVGWAMSDSLERQLVINALHMALQARRPPPGPDLWLVIRRNIDNPAELKFYFSNAPADVPLLELVRLSGLRWPVETIFEESKRTKRRL